MGWDCTLHVVDPIAISKTMARLSQGKPAPAELLAAYERGESIWAEAKQRVMEGPLDEAAVFACQLAILSAAALHPHHYERGVALSFGVDPTPHSCGPWIPETFKASPEVMMTPLLKKRPELAGRFHRAFEHNSDTGVFIPAKHVAEAADSVRGQLFDKEVAERERYWGLYWVLRAAARNGLAYWEATDLGVANTRREMIAPPSASFEWLREGANRSLAVVDGTVFLSREADTQSLAIDARVTPTEPRPCPAGFGARASRLASGEWAACAKGELRIFDARDGIPHELARAIEVPISTTIGDSVIVRACGDGAVLLPFSYSGRLDQRAYWFDGEVVRAIEGLPAPKLGSRHGTNWYAIAATTLGSDNSVILWNGEGYEIDNGSVVGAPWRLDLQIKDAVQSITAWGQDGFYFGDDQTLRRVRRGAPPETVAKLPDKIRELAPGPDGSVLVVHSLHPTKHKQERSVTLVFPERGEEIAVNRYDVQLASLQYTGGFFWGAARKVRTDSSSDHAFRLPESVILSMPPSPLKAPKR